MGIRQTQSHPTLAYFMTLLSPSSLLKLREKKAPPPRGCLGHAAAAAAAAKSLQSSPALCDHIDGRPPGSAVPGILQARVLEWVAIAFSSA